MTRILLPVDGSPTSDRAARYVAANQPGAQVFLLNVEPLPAGWQTRGIEQDAVLSHLHAVSLEALKSAHEILREAGVRHEVHEALGDIGETVAAKAREFACDAIVMGTHGRGAVAGLVMGSVARKVVHLSPLPVTLVK